MLPPNTCHYGKYNPVYIPSHLCRWFNEMLGSISFMMSRIGNLYTGSNLLGRLLMELRDDGKLTFSLPSDTLEFTTLVV